MTHSLRSFVLGLERQEENLEKGLESQDGFGLRSLRVIDNIRYTSNMPVDLGAVLSKGAKYFEGKLLDRIGRYMKLEGFLGKKETKKEMFGSKAGKKRWFQFFSSGRIFAYFEKEPGAWDARPKWAFLTRDISDIFSSYQKKKEHFF
jgi:hypothetical protein